MIFIFFFFLFFSFRHFFFNIFIFRDYHRYPFMHIANTYKGSIMFHVRRRPADSQPRKRKKKPLGVSNGGNNMSIEREGPMLVEITHTGDGGRRVKLSAEPIEVKLNLIELYSYFSFCLYLSLYPYANNNHLIQSEEIVVLIIISKRILFMCTEDDKNEKKQKIQIDYDFHNLIGTKAPNVY